MCLFFLSLYFRTVYSWLRSLTKRTIHALIKIKLQLVTFGLPRDIIITI